MATEMLSVQNTSDGPRFVVRYHAPNLAAFVPVIDELYLLPGESGEVEVDEVEAARLRAMTVAGTDGGLVALPPE